MTHDTVPMFEILVKAFKTLVPSTFKVKDAATLSRITGRMGERPTIPYGQIPPPRDQTKDLELSPRSLEQDLEAVIEQEATPRQCTRESHQVRQ